MNYSLIIPIYNEEQSIEKLLAQINKIDKNIEIIIVNDGSTDDTKVALGKLDTINVINHFKNKGKGAAIITAVKYATNDNIILMDGDLEINLNCIPSLIEKYEFLDNHVILGSRWNKKRKNENNINTYGNFLFNFLFNFLYNTQITDVLCCVKVLKKSLFNSINLKSQGFSIEAEIMSKLAINKTRFYEVYVTYNRRTNKDGKKLKISDGWSILWQMLANKINY